MKTQTELACIWPQCMFLGVPVPCIVAFVFILHFSMKFSALLVQQ